MDNSNLKKEKYLDSEDYEYGASMSQNIAKYSSSPDYEEEESAPTSQPDSTRESPESSRETPPMDATQAFRPIQQDTRRRTGHPGGANPYPSGNAYGQGYLVNTPNGNHPNGNYPDSTPNGNYPNGYYSNGNYPDSTPTRTYTGNISNKSYPGRGPGGNLPYPPTAAPNNSTPSRPQQGGQKTSPMTYVLITISCVCLVAIAVLAIYFFQLSRAEEILETAVPTHNIQVEATETDPIPTETQSPSTDTPWYEEESTEEYHPEDSYTEPTTEAPTTEEPTTQEDSRPAYLDELNRKYENYFDFQPDENGHVLAHSSTRLLSTWELYGMTEHQVCIARNEIYARHGYIFKTEKYNEYFSNFSWYVPTTHNLPDVNDIEDQNVKMIVAFEKSQGWD